MPAVRWEGHSVGVVEAVGKLDQQHQQISFSKADQRILQQFCSRVQASNDFALPDFLCICCRHSFKNFLFCIDAITTDLFESPLTPNNSLRCTLLHLVGCRAPQALVESHRDETRIEGVVKHTASAFSKTAAAANNKSDNKLGGFDMSDVPRHPSLASLRSLRCLVVDDSPLDRKVSCMSVPSFVLARLCRPCIAFNVMKQCGCCSFRCLDAATYAGEAIGPQRE